MKIEIRTVVNEVLAAGKSCPKKPMITPPSQK
jgi:hypothetical protein